MAKSKSMVIVESPAKAKTINKFLGSSYFVQASMGNIRDLPAKRFGVDVANNFKPEYEIISGKRKIVLKLRNAAKDADTVYLATDSDREGEAIAWHLQKALGIAARNAYRVTFNEITKNAIREAFKSPGRIDMNKVNAQQARRILDRLVGYEISPLLWKKITKGLSAGRVQSVAVRLIVEREKEIQVFKPEEYWKITAELKPQGEDTANAFLAELKKKNNEKLKVTNKDQAESIVAELKDKEYIVSNVTKKERPHAAPPPFITSTLQQQASVKLRFSAKKTMMLAQQLYEGIEIGDEGSAGLITYMRTDSVNVSNQAISECRDLILEKFGGKYLPEKPNRFKSRSEAQEAHEAIRPTSAARTPEDVKPYLTEEQQKLYELVWKRFVASQMKPAIYAVTNVDIKAGNYLFQASGRELIFDGHTILSGHSLKKDEQILPVLAKGKMLDLLGLKPTQHFTKPPPRYTEATLVRTLEMKGIGRPSTYAQIISTIQERGYVKQEQRQFHATELGILVTDKLVQHFPKILDVGFTSHMEDQLDKIEENGVDWVKILEEFYGPFKTALEKAKKEMTSVKGDASIQTDVKCDKCGKPMVERWSKKGKFLGCSGYPDCDNTMPLGKEGKPLQDQLTEFKCDKCGSPLVIKTGRRGKFFACSAYPKCENTKDVGEDGTPVESPRSQVEETDEKCDKCGSPMVIRSGRRGKFLACSAFPKCRNTKNIDASGKPAEPEFTGENCEKCGSPMVVKYGRRGKFAACSAYPKCKNAKPLSNDAASDEPQKTDVKCDKCGSDMLIKSGRYGKFMACSAYPKCKNTMPLNEKKTEEHQKEDKDSSNVPHSELELIGRASKTVSDNLTIHVDGASRGNPGSAAFGVVIYDGDSNLIEQAGEMIGKATNNVAEYKGLIFGAKRAIELGAKKVIFKSDSELMVKQINGTYKVRSANIIPLYKEAMQILTKIPEWSIQHIPREDNQEADAQANLALDEKTIEEGS